LVAAHTSVLHPQHQSPFDLLTNGQPRNSNEERLGTGVLRGERKVSLMMSELSEDDLAIAEQRTAPKVSSGNSTPFSRNDLRLQISLQALYPRYWWVQIPRAPRRISMGREFSWRAPTRVSYARSSLAAGLSEKGKCFFMEDL
jgi:hypothetical protein